MATRDPLELASGDVDRASLDAAERLRARLTGQPLPQPRSRPRTIWPWVIAGGLFVFTAGMIANPWFEAAVRGHLPFADQLGPRVAEDADLVTLQQRLARLEARTATAPAPVERLARTEAKIEISADQLQREAERVDRLTAELGSLSAAVLADRSRNEASAATAAAAAARADGLLTLLLTRRALDRGVTLGPLDPALRRLFEADNGRAVAAVTALGSAPVSRAGLVARFRGLGLRTRQQPGEAVGWWTALRLTLGAAVSAVGTPDRPADVAAMALSRGEVAAAAAALRRLPPTPDLTAWLADADRLVAGEAGLAALEQKVLLVPAPVPLVAAPPAPVAVAPPAPAG